MARPVAYPDHIEPLVHFVEETPPEHIVARTHDKLAAGTPVKEMLLAGALAGEGPTDPAPRHHCRPPPPPGAAHPPPRPAGAPPPGVRAPPPDPHNGTGPK